MVFMVRWRNFRFPETKLPFAFKLLAAFRLPEASQSANELVYCPIGDSLVQRLTVKCGIRCQVGEWNMRAVEASNDGQLARIRHCGKHLGGPMLLFV